MKTRMTMQLVAVTLVALLAVYGIFFAPLGFGDDDSSKDPASMIIVENPPYISSSGESESDLSSSEESIPSSEEGSVSSAYSSDVSSGTNVGQSQSFVSESTKPPFSGGNSSSSSASLSSSISSGSSASSSHPSSEVPSSSNSSVSSSSSGTESLPDTVPTTEEFRGVWISYVNLSNAIRGKNFAAFKAKIDEMLDMSKCVGMNAVLVHVRPFSDALYPSEYFPWSYVLTGTQGKNPGYDPLEYIVEAAHARGLEIHAWVNPLRVALSSVDSSAADPTKLSSDNIVRKWLTGSDSSKHNYAVRISKSGQYGIFLNPAYSEVRKLIVDGVREIAENYDVDGICIDDYFYPTTDVSFDSKEYADYLGSLSPGAVPLTLKEWRTNNINLLVGDMYSAIKRVNKDIVFGISPQANLNNNKNMLYADVERWSKVEGYCDYICPQIYFTFNHKTLPFATAASQWKALVTNPKVKLYIALGVYRIGEVSEYDNWNTPEGDILKRQVIHGRETTGCKGFTFFDYDSFVRFANTEEMRNLKSVLVSDN